MANCDYTYAQVKSGTGNYSYESPAQYSDGVKTMQQRLRSCGYTDVTADGYFGSGTRLAVRRFQQCMYGLTNYNVDGIAGKNTLTQLDAVYNKVAFTYGASLCSTPSLWTESSLASSTWNNWSKRIDALARVIYAEDNYSDAARAAVARVIYNRANESTGAHRRSGVSNKFLAVLSKSKQYGTVPETTESLTNGDGYDVWPSDGDLQRAFTPPRGNSGTSNYINPAWNNAVTLATQLEEGYSISTSAGYPVTIVNGAPVAGSSATANLTSSHMYQVGSEQFENWIRLGYNMTNIITYDRSLEGNFFFVM